MILPCEHSTKFGTHLQVSAWGARFVARATYGFRVLVVRDTVVVDPLLPTLWHIYIGDIRH